MSSTERTALFAEVTGNIYTENGDNGMFGITQEFSHAYEYVVNVYINSVVCVLGLLGNTLGVHVLRKDLKNRTSTYRYMLALMLVDNVALVLGIVNSILTIIGLYDIYLHNFITNHLPFVSAFVDSTSFHGSSIILLIMSLERLNALIRPFKVKQSWFSNYPDKTIILIFIIIIVFLLPFPFSFEVLSFTNHENRTVYILRTKPSHINFYNIYNFAETLITCVYPVVLLFINIAIPIVYRHVVQKRKSELRTSSNVNQQLRITLVVLWLAISYTMFLIPEIFLQCLIYLDYNYQSDGKYAPTFYFFLYTGDLLHRLNAANDFYIYILISERERKIIRYMFCKQCVSEEDLRISRHTSTSSQRTKSQYITEKDPSKNQPVINVIDYME